MSPTGLNRDHLENYLVADNDTQMTEKVFFIHTNMRSLYPLAKLY